MSITVTQTVNEISITATQSGVSVTLNPVLQTTASGGLSNVVEDTSPQLGGNLDPNGFVITGYQLKPSEGAFVDGDKTKLDNIENGADITDSTNVDSAGAVMNSDTSTASMNFVIDEDNMSSNSATKVPTQQSVKAYVDANSGSSSPLTTKGDIYTYSTVDARLAVGTDGYVLKADSGETTGLIWAAETGGTSYIYDVKVDYSALGDGVEYVNGAITATDATFTDATNTPFVAGDVGKVIHIAGAGTSGAYHTTTIASYTSAGEVELTDVAVTTVSGATYVFGTDDTAAIQSAITACHTAGGGEVFIPNGIYIIDGALQNNIGADLIDYNSQLYIPRQAETERDLVTVLIRGEIEPYVVGGTGIDTIERPQLTGSVILSTIQGSGTDPSVLCSRGENSGTFFDLMNNSQTFVENLSILVTPDANAKVTMGGINMYRSIVTGIDRVVCFPYNTNLFDSGQPDVINVTGISFSAINGTKTSYIRNCNVGGFTYGFRIGEHGLMTNVGANCCTTGILFEGNNHTSTVVKAHLDWCKYSISSNASQAQVNIMDMQSEYYSNSKWYDTTYHVNDSGNYLHGVINFNIVNAGVGFDNSLFAYTGASNLKFVPISYDNPYNSQSSSYTFVFMDAYRYVFAAASSGFQDLTVPANGTVPFKIGDELKVYQTLGGKVKIKPAATVTLNYQGVNELNGAGSKVSLIKTGTNTWQMGGDLLKEAPVPFESCIRYYRMDGDSTDERGVGDGTDTSMTYTTGKSGQCAVFAGGSNYISIADAADLSFGDGSTDSPFSMTFFINATTIASRFLINKRGTSTNREYQIYFSAGSLLQFHLRDDSTAGYIEVTTSTAISTGSWVHIALTYDGSSSASGLKVYVDGIQVATSDSSSGSYTAMENGTSALVLGTQAWALGTSSYTGSMDCFGIWDKELSKREILAIRNLNNLGTEII